MQDEVATRSGASTWFWRAQHNPSAALLLVQLVAIFLYPLFDHLSNGQALINLLGLVVLGTALRMVRRSPATTWIAVVLALLVGSLLLAHALSPHPNLQLMTAALEAVFYFYAAGSLIAYMMADQQATPDELFAAGATFTLLAWAYAYLFLICQMFVPGSFHADAAIERSWLELLFLSFTTLSGVGLSDILPLTPMARSLIMLEEFSGVMYIALVVSRLIGMTVTRHSDAAR